MNGATAPAREAAAPSSSAVQAVSSAWKSLRPRAGRGSTPSLASAGVSVASRRLTKEGPSIPSAREASDFESGQHVDVVG